MNRKSPVRYACIALICLVVCLATATAHAQSFGINVSSLVGTPGDDEITAAEIQSDGTVLVGGTFESAPPFADAETIGAASDDDNGYLFVLSTDGLTVERTLRVGASVHDMALDEDENVFIAAGASGVVQLDPNLEWRRTKTVGNVYRVDAGGGIVAALAPTNTETPHQTPGPGTVTLLDIASGAEEGSFNGYQNTLDLCVDGDSQIIGVVGWRSDELDGLPIQIAYLRGYDFTGFVDWISYDWGTAEGQDGYINTPGDNSSSTRGYRCSIGADGMMYAGFEADGAKHQFRFAPQDIEEPVEIVGGDKFHEFSNVRNEQKVFFGRYEPSDGTYALGQQLVARVGNDSGNTVRMRRGAIEADANGNVYVAGESAFGLPIQFLPPDTGNYTGGAYLLAMNSDFSERRYVTRITPNGAAYDVAVRPEIGDDGVVVYGGSHQLEDGGFYRKNWFQDEGGGETDGFVTVFGEGVEDMGGPGGGGGGGDDNGCGCSSGSRSPASSIVLGVFVWAVISLRRRLFQ